MVLQKENNNPPASELKDMEYCNLIDTDFSIAVTKKFNKLQDNSRRLLKELRNKVNEQDKFFTKEIKILKKVPNRNSRAEEISELKNMRNTLESTRNIEDQREERI